MSCFVEFVLIVLGVCIGWGIALLVLLVFFGWLSEKSEFVTYGILGSLAGALLLYVFVHAYIGHCITKGG